MPRVLNPGTIANGGGLAAQKSVEASAFVHPTQGLDGLIAHIVDPSRAHEARAINLVDVGGYYSSDNVEGALQEIGGGLSSTGQNGVLEGCGFSAAGLTISLDTPSTVRVGTSRDLSGDSITLTNNQTCWVYVNTSGVLTHSIGASPPSFSSPENVLLWQVITSGGVITSQTDMRWFVLNIDRKPFLTVRSAGTDTNKHSEASFETLEGAMLYLEHFGAGDMRTHTVIIKGPMTIASTIVVPTNNVTFQGEDNCQLSTSGTLAPMFNVSDRSRIVFRDITFFCNGAGSIAIQSTTFGTGYLVERCIFSSGSNDWDVAIDWNAAAAIQQSTIRNCFISVADTGIRVEYAVDLRIQDTVVQDLTGTSGFMGIKLGPLVGGIGVTANNQIRGCRTAGFGIGIGVRGARMKVLESFVQDSNTGIAVGLASEDVVLSETSISLNATTGINGVTLEGTYLKVRGCRINNPRLAGAYTVEVPTGISVTTGATNVQITDCEVTNFLNSVAPAGYGIVFQGTADNSTVQGTTISAALEGIYCVGAAARFRVTGCNISDVQRGLFLQADATVGDTSIRLHTTLAMYGIIANGNDTTISNCRVNNPRSAASYGASDIPIGIYIATASRCSVTGTDINGFWNPNNGTFGQGYGIVGEGDHLSIVGGVIDTASHGVNTANGENVQISGVAIRNVDTGIRVQDGTNISNCSVYVRNATASIPAGRYGILIQGDNVTITGCQLHSTRTTFAGGDDPIAINASPAQYVKVTNCLIRGWRDTANSTGYGFLTDTSPGDNITFTGNTVETCWNGFTSTASASVDHIVVADNVFRDIDLDGIVVSTANNVSIVDNLLIDAGTANAIYVANSTNLEISGNTIDGAGVTDSGITLTGVDAVNSRTRQFVMSNNTIKAFSGRGISIIDYVQNGVVSGNHVDGFIPAAPSDYASIACVVIEGLSSGNLPKYIEFTGNTLWRSKNGVMVYGVDINDPITNVSIQGNNIHHCAAGYTSPATVSCIAIDVFWAEDVSICNNDIDRMGRVISNSDVESFPAAGPDVAPFGIRMRNCSRMNVSENNFSDIMRNGVGFATVVSLSNRDTGSTLDARSVAINGNNITTSAGVALPPHIGISVTSGQETSGTGAATSLLGVTIANNTIRRLAYEGILLFAAGGSSVQQVNISSNSVSLMTDATFGYGIWIGTGKSTAFGGGVLREVSISGNNVANTGTTGIYVTSDENTSVSHVAIRGNTIADTGARGIEVYEGSFSSSTVLSTEFGNFIVDGNNISGPTTQGIRFFSQDFDLSDLTVTNNVVTGANGTSAPHKALEFDVAASTAVTGTATAGGATTITLAGGSSAIDDYYVGWEVTITSGTGSGQNRTITDYNGTTKVATVGSAWGTNPNATSVYALLRIVAPTRWTVSGNRFYGDGTSTLIDILVDGILTGFTFTDNQVLHEVGTGSRCLNIDCNPSGTLGSEKFAGNWVFTGNTFAGGTGIIVQLRDGVKLWDVNFSDNTVIKSASYGFHLDMDDATGGSPGTLASVSNFTMDSNTFEAGGVVGALEAIRLWFGDATDQVDAVADVSVTNNRIQLWNNTTGNDPRAIWLRYNARCIGLNITGNTLQANGNIDAGVQGTAGMIDVELGQDGALSPFASRNINISNNILTNNYGGYGIYVHKYTGATNAYARGLCICGNEIHGGWNGIATFYAADAIRVDLTGFTADGALTPTNPGDVVIDGNVIHTNKHNTGTVSDVGIVFIGPTAATLENISISNNSLSDTGGGDGTTSFGAINLDINDPIYGLVVAGNSTENSSGDGLYHTSNAASQNLVFARNHVHSPAGEGINVVLTGAVDNLDVSSNAVSASGSTGILVAPSQALINASVSHNELRSITGTGIQVDSSFVNESINVRIDNNHINGSVIGILCEHAGSATTWSVSHNHITDPTGAAIDIRMGFDGTETTELFTVVGNVINNPTGYGIEFHHNDSAGTVVGIRIDGNSVSDGDSTGIYFHTDASVVTSSMSNNIVLACGGGLAIDLDGGVYGYRADKNIIRNIGSSGMLVNFNSTSATHRVISVSDNQVYDVDDHGIYMKIGGTSTAAASAEVDVSRNQIRNFATDYAQTAELAGILIYKRDAQFEGLSVNNNTIEVYVPAGGGIEHEGNRYGIFLDIQSITSVLRMQVNYNNIQMTTVIDVGDIAYAMRVALGSGGSILPRNHVYMGNILKAGRLTYGGSATDYGIAIGNISDDATHNWTAFTSTWTNSEVFHNIDNG